MYPSSERDISTTTLGIPTLLEDFARLRGAECAGIIRLLRDAAPDPLTASGAAHPFSHRSRSLPTAHGQLLNRTAMFVAVKVPVTGSKRPDAVTAMTADPVRSLESWLTKSENVLKLSFIITLAWPIVKASLLCVSGTIVNAPSARTSIRFGPTSMMGPLPSSSPGPLLLLPDPPLSPPLLSLQLSPDPGPLLSLPPPEPWSRTVVIGPVLPSPPWSPSSPELQLTDNRSITSDVLFDDRPLKTVVEPCRPKRSLRLASIEGAVTSVSAVKSGGAVPNPVTNPSASADELTDRPDCVKLPVFTT